MTFKKICIVVGARPNFMKIGSIIRELQKVEISFFIVHTGQHYDDKMSKVFFEDLHLPRPDFNLEVGSGTHAQQTAQIMIGFEKVIEKINPDLVIVVGDVNSTLACSLVAVKLGIKVAHVEAGLRSFNRTMPEEINRVLTDAIADYLFVTESEAINNLLNEGRSRECIFLVGNVMIDTLKSNITIAETQSNILEGIKLTGKKYAVLTLHRPYNVDEKEPLDDFLNFLDKIQKEMHIVFPIHPRTFHNIVRFGLRGKLDSMNNLIICEPLGYLDFIKLMNHSSIVLTDSGGVQEETSILGVPCLTLRPETERPITIKEGTNVLVGQDYNLGFKKFLELKNKNKEEKKIQYWDGKAGVRIVNVLKQLNP